MRYLVNYAIAILSSNRQTLWETRRVRLTEKKWLVPNLPNQHALVSYMSTNFCPLSSLKAHTEPGTIDSKCSKITLMAKSNRTILTILNICGYYIQLPSTAPFL